MRPNCFGRLSILFVTFVDPGVSFQEKVSSFLDNVERFGQKLDAQENFDIFAFFYLVAMESDKYPSTNRNADRHHTIYPS